MGSRETIVHTAILSEIWRYNKKQGTTNAT